ncbi:MAG: sulfite exporter TauE/SafE family protein [Bacteroidetes bacterium]|nr:sulfite exporter TauE/SafE family protein [Bacteroidota bacterium]
MDLIIIGFFAAFASLLTFFSGFGLGTILLPVFAVFFPMDVAIALTGIVHLLNNLFKMTLVGKKANWRVVLKFGIPAIIGAFFGAQLLMRVSGETQLASYDLLGETFYITPIKLTIAILMISFSLLEITPMLKKIKFNKERPYAGGLISGFFGGLSGHQGALRSVFLIKYGLPKEAYIATGVFIASVIDITRISVYFTKMSDIDISGNILTLSVAVGAAFVGAVIGKLLLKKITLGFVQITVMIMIILLGIALGLGLL